MTGRVDFQKFRPNQQVDDVVLHFLRGPLSQREFRSLNAADMLDQILGSPAAPDIALRLDPTSAYHHKIIRNDHLSSILGSSVASTAMELLQDGRRGDAARIDPDDALHIREFLDRYESLMTPFIIGVFEHVQTPGSDRNQLPQGMFDGLQGLLHTHILTRYMLEHKLQLDPPAIGEAITHTKITQQTFQEQGLGGVLMTRFGNRTAEMIYSTLKNHPNPEFQSYFADLELRHFTQINNFWTTKQDARPGKGWRYHTQEGEWRNYPEAREASKEVLHPLMGLPIDHDLPTNQYIQRCRTLIKTITQDDFDNTPGRYGRSYASVRHIVYGGSIPAVVIDFLRNHEQSEVREEFRALRSYHFPRINNGPVLARPNADFIGAFHELARILTDQSGPFAWSMSELPARLNGHIMETTELEYGGTVMRYMPPFKNQAYAWCAFFANHPERHVRTFFKGIQPYHFGRTPNDFWSRSGSIEDGPPDDGWNYCKEDKSWKNYGAARSAVSEFVDLLLMHNHSWEWNLEKIPTSLVLSDFGNHPIRFQSIIKPMIGTVYFDSAREALQDFFQSSDFEELVARRPRLQNEIAEKWGSVEDYKAYAIETLKKRRGHRDI